MDIGDLALPTESVHRLINIARRHFRKRADAALQRIGQTGLKIKQTLVQVGLINQTRLATPANEKL